MSDGRQLRDRLRRTALALRARLHTDLHLRLGAIERLVGEMPRELAELRARLDRIEVDSSRAAQIGRQIYDEEPANRRRLAELRRGEEYRLAFEEPEPLVTVVIPTYTSFQTLRDVALPSVLGQSHGNLEVIVSGDSAPPETAAVIAGLGDPRVVYLNRTIRGPYPEDPAKRWFGIGGPPFNDALAIARGRWITALGDDDAFRPHHVGELLAAAREHGYEHCYGRQEVHFASGDPIVLGAFPPRLGQWGMQAALYHSGLRFFESELSDSIYDEPSDWSKCRRMVRAGVRFGMVDSVVVDKYESRRASAEEWRTAGPPRLDG